MNENSCLENVMKGTKFTVCTICLMLIGSGWSASISINLNNAEKLQRIEQQFEELKEELKLLKEESLHHHRSRKAADVILNKNQVPQRSCKEIYDDDNTAISGLYKTAPTDNKGEFTVFCDMTTSGGGWTVIQRRENNATDFYRGWQEYKTGFGTLDGNFWLGLEKIHRITQIENHELLVTMVHPDGKTFTSKYDLFKVDSAATDYQLDLGEYIRADEHDGGNSFSYHDNQKFSTFDRDNDLSLENCAEKHHGAWWYKSCHEVNLNGRYYDGNYGNYDGNDPLAVEDGIVWLVNTGWWHSLKSVTMAIKPKYY